MNAREIIERKKRGHGLDPAEIEFMVGGFTAGTIPDYQVAAFLMAVWFRGMGRDETQALLAAMLHSGRVLDLHDIPGPKIDKHSTGGVGDKVSLPLAGIAAACGLRVPMVSGRGLGHTGGTLDKLEAIPGYRTAFDLEAYRRTLLEVGATIVGQSADLVPADRVFYALRDVTATVDCIPLIAASILSKKFASGAEGVVMDVKVGSGAFMADLVAARALAEVLMEMGAAFGRRIAVVFSRMDEPLGVAVGNAVEVVESVDLLRGRGPEDLRALTLELAGEMLRLGGLAPDAASGVERARRALDDGSGLDRFLRLVRAHGGRLDPDRPECGLEVAPVAAAVTAPGPGWLAGVDGYAVGMAVVDLHGGRQRQEDAIDPAVGLRWHGRIGRLYDTGAPLFEILARPGQDVEAVSARLRRALTWGEDPVTSRPLVLDRMTGR